jgi:hypothetical protein
MAMHEYTLLTEVVMKWLMVITLLLLTYVCSAQMTNESAQPLTLRTCEGDVVICDQSMTFRGYKFVAEKVLGDEKIALKSQDGTVTAILDLQADENIFLTIHEGSISMQVKSCVRQILRGDEPVVASFLDRAGRCREAKTILRQGLLAVNM